MLRLLLSPFTKKTNNKKLTEEKEKIINEKLLPLIEPIYYKMLNIQKSNNNEFLIINNKLINKNITNFVTNYKIITEDDVRSYFKKNNNEKLIKVKEKIIYKKLFPVIVPIYYNILKNQKSKNNEISKSNNELINQTITNFLTNYKIIHEDDVKSYLEKKHNLIQSKVYEIEKINLIEKKQIEKTNINTKIKEINNKLVLTDSIKNNLNQLLSSNIFLYRILREILKNNNIIPSLYKKKKNQVAYENFFKLFQTNELLFNNNTHHNYTIINIGLFKKIKNELSESIEKVDYKKNIIEYMNNLEEQYKIKKQLKFLEGSGSSSGQTGTILFESEMNKFKREFPDEKIITFEYN